MKLLIAAVAASFLTLAACSPSEEPAAPESADVTPADDATVVEEEVVVEEVAVEEPETVVVMEAPVGTYIATCQNITFEGTTLTADCANADTGDLVSSTLDVAVCQAVENLNGVLTCVE